ncbi:MAG TPA: LysR family transcriptional regulator [Stellaceae bacterium]|nr:LysR family transcriptional regulator [Stellaceae bacterium]
MPDDRPARHLEVPVLEIHQVRYFLALADTLNFTKAAEQCNVSQPALTRAIQLLERELGGLLFHRERANTHLTELGRMVQPFMRQSFEAAQRTKLLAEEFAKAKKKTLKVGIMCTIAPDQMIDLITAMQSRHPDVELQLCDANAWDLEKQLLDGRLEIAIYCLPGKEPHERTHVMPLFREQIVIAINLRHRLANQAAIRVRELDGECYIHRGNCEFAGYADPVFTAQNVKCKAAYWSDRDDWTLAMVAAGVGWAFMPENSVTHPEVVGIPLTEPEFWRVVNLVSVRGREHAAPVGAFLREAMRHKWFGKKAISIEPTTAALSETSAD